MAGWIVLYVGLDWLSALKVVLQGQVLQQSVMQKLHEGPQNACLGEGVSTGGQVGNLDGLLCHRSTREPLLARSKFQLHGWTTTKGLNGDINDE
ncbi:hypothetical protein JMJ77_0011294 [Colletotrichum scovillei]|uniref:Secreted protein n=1 Tax=Colletotrichum scovillei TaxID=1209932 RepID=A0A9P7R518_9PEZI|nr:hypothetical protein JMJ77_0011294 [Colletotrichum scovillei]KAG7060273.1 hypothetical protein JMJ78_0015548 [Colletotrichum scovillei]KAG7067723.1 hypothetical protein JMJ76_0009151 [Colletotrichum scovillei]